MWTTRRTSCTLCAASDAFKLNQVLLLSKALHCRAKDAYNNDPASKTRAASTLHHRRVATTSLNLFYLQNTSSSSSRLQSSRRTMATCATNPSCSSSSSVASISFPGASPPPPPEKLISRNPRTNEIIHEYAEMSEMDVLAVLTELHTTFQKTPWRRPEWTSKRCEVIRRIGELLTDEVEELAELVHCEMGKRVDEAKGEVLKTAGLCKYYADHGAAFLEPKEMPPPPGLTRTYYVFAPLGTILSIMPWNFPIWQVFRMAIPVMLAGNCTVLKHAPNVNGCALLCERIVRQAVKDTISLSEESAPAEAVVPFRTLLIQAAQTPFVLSHPTVHGVSLTGSERAGRAVAALAGGLLKKAVVELGGNDGYVLLEGNGETIDAKSSIPEALETIVKGRLLNTGQSCIGPKRIIVQGGSARKKFVEDKLVEILTEKKDAVDFSVLVHAAAKDEVQKKVETAIRHGARCIFGDPSGGKQAATSSGSSTPTTTASAFFNPVVLTDMTLDNPAADVEIFGPVFSIFSVETEAEAVALHNSSSFGLGGAVFGPDAEHARQLAERELDAGMVSVNDFVRSDASLPFGGIKSSGLGRECGSFGVHEFTNVKTISIR